MVTEHLIHTVTGTGTITLVRWWKRVYLTRDVRIRTEASRCGVDLHGLLLDHCCRTNDVLYFWCSFNLIPHRSIGVFAICLMKLLEFPLEWG